MLSVFMLSVTILNVIVLSVVAPKERLIKNLGVSRIILENHFHPLFPFNNISNTEL